MNTERGLKNLEDLLKSTSEGATSSEYLDFVGWSRELRESIEEKSGSLGSIKMNR
jgi:antirestriction protein